MNKEPDRSQRKALGKGLSALLPSRSKDPAPERTEPAILTPIDSAKESLPPEFKDFQSLPLDQISPGEGQPRDNFDDQKLEELAQSIRAHGVIQPITVYRASNNAYRIVAGERRWRAAKLAGLSEIPALVRQTANEELLELALIENIQREDLNPIEIALAFQTLQNVHRLTHEQIAERTGKDRSSVTNFLRLLKLSPAARDALVDGTITMGHAKALVNLTNPEAQASICREIKDKQLSVRDTEGYVRRLTQPREPVESENAAAPPPIDPNIRAALDEISRALGTKVKLCPRNEKSGRIEIEYYSTEDLDRIYSVIVGER